MNSLKPPVGLLIYIYCTFAIFHQKMLFEITKDRQYIVIEYVNKTYRPLAALTGLEQCCSKQTKQYLLNEKLIIKYNEYMY